ncbi:universal stress protein [Calothrix sp. UHCC 0171]|uniref:universal stress protein n=1 Tax=Calothrix sp. UHCC 0171 TaxID=3110245 RepID=UPI002B2069D7|nr:universal stress protein [Calothrix sp. UHCC 0171]MEA5572695.1 universal stress protein [Calothrix sp. UHCC 0171]
MKYKKILVAMDNSLQAAKVFQAALDIAQKCGSKLMLFNCMNNYFLDESAISIGTMADVDIYGTLQQQHRQNLQQEITKTQAWLEAYCQQAHIRKVEAEFTYKFGEPSKQICNFAKTWNADLIVLGRRGHKGITEILLGSVSNYTLHHAPCTVLIVQEKVVVKEKKQAHATTVAY